MIATRLISETIGAPLGQHWYELRLTLQCCSVVTGHWTAFKGKGDVRASINNQARMAVVGRTESNANRLKSTQSGLLGWHMLRPFLRRGSHSVYR